MELLLTAASRSAYAASFSAAKLYVDAADDLTTESGGLEAWLKGNRYLQFRRIELLSQLCGVLGQYEEALRKVSCLLIRG